MSSLLVRPSIVKVYVIASHARLLSFSPMKINTTDKTYRAVIGANEAMGEAKYHIVGGSAGSVSPCKFAFIFDFVRHTYNYLSSTVAHHFVLC